ncbi:MAG TPA: monovalent cation:proton antiporter-2 (CPA2) family protein [Phenylobacterium sp.]|nr:monovalent cation:proton antiporter-2 (CPA2) family protein [Phenylobacterium sp.]
MAAEAGVNLGQVVAVLGAGIVAGPLFKRLGFGSILGYLVAGVIIGPFGLKVFREPQTTLHVAEFGVIMFLFIIGLEMRPRRLWSMKKDIFGLGAAQVAGCGALLTLAGAAVGIPPVVAFIGAMGFVLSSTAVIVQTLEEDGEIATPAGQRAVAILLMEDLMIVPLLAVVALLAPAQSGESAVQKVLIGLGALVAFFIIGRFALNPMFRLLSRARAREVMTAAALAVVLGAALFMQVGGLSMAMGAFLAGVLLSESSYRHQLEADIEPFRGILLGLFFIAVGMSLDLAVVLSEWRVLGLILVGLMALKAFGIYLIARLFKARPREAVQRAALFAQGGEFAFVLYAAATAADVIDARENAVATAAVILSMVLTPVVLIGTRRLLPVIQPDIDGVEAPDGLQGSVLVIGFGRFGQVASQSLLARGVDVSLIDLDPEMVRDAAPFGFKVYYGDGTRLDILRASGAESARLILVCVENKDTANRIVELVKSEFPQAALMVRAFDRGHALDLVKAGVDVQLRETFESALAFGGQALKQLGLDPHEAAETVADIRQRDSDRFDLEITGGIYAGVGLLHGNAPVPGPLFNPRRAPKPAAEPDPAPATSG